MVETCVSRNLNIDGGILGIEPWSTPRLVFDQSYASVGDGAFTQQTTLPGKLMIDSGIQTWTNDSPLDAMVLIRVQRSYRNWVVSNPNAVQIRDRFTYAIGGEDPRIPDVSSVYHGHSGGALDVGSLTTGATIIGKYWDWEDGTLLEDWLGPVPAGDALKIWYRCNLWTPPPWSNNANNGSPEHSASVRGVRLVLMSFPTRDSAVVS